jgi:hypothetical protein
VRHGDGDGAAGHRRGRRSASDLRRNGRAGRAPPRRGARRSVDPVMGSPRRTAGHAVDALSPFPADRTSATCNCWTC